MNDYKYVLVGGGVAAAQAAVGIREIDRDGKAVIIASETWWPYDRPPLSKGMLLGKATPEDAESKDPSWYKKNNVEVRRGVRAEHVDRSNRTVALSDGSTLKYDKLLLATGATPKRLQAKGADLPGVHLLRTVNDSLAIREAIGSSKSAVMIGAGYIGLEVASACLLQGVPVTFADPSEWPWSKFVSRQTGEFLKKEYEKAGATFRLSDQAEQILGERKAEKVKLRSGQEIPADLVVVGVGVSLNLELPRKAGLQIDEEHGVIVDDQLRSQDENVYIAGDIAAFPDATIGKRWHAEHYLNAKWQGKQAGRNMAGAGERYEQVPYFFSDFLDLHMALRGDPQGGKSGRTLGDREAGEFVELYAREDGTLAMGIAFTREEPKLDPISDGLERLVRERARVADISEESVGMGAQATLR